MRVHKSGENENHVAWSADGKQLVFEAADEEAPSAGPHEISPSVQVQESAAEGSQSVETSDVVPYPMPALDLVAVDVATGESRTLAHSATLTWFYVSPNGATALLVRAKGYLRTSAQRNDFDITAVDVATASERLLASDVVIRTAPYAGVSWSPDSTRVAYVAVGALKEVGATGGKDDCYVLSLAGGEPRDLTRGVPLSFRSNFRAPLWDHNGKSLYLISADFDRGGLAGIDTLWVASVADEKVRALARIPDHLLLDVVPDTEGHSAGVDDPSGDVLVETLATSNYDAGFWRISPSTGASSRVSESPVFLGEETGAYRANVLVGGRELLFARQTADRPITLWVHDLMSGRERLVADLNPQLSGVAMGKSLSFNYLDGDGVPSKGGLLLPAGYQPGRSYPTVVWLYPGKHLPAQVNQFGLERGDASGASLNAQVLAGSGYAVLVADVSMEMDRPMTSLSKTVLPAVNRAVELGVADPLRLFVFGQSHGGYLSMGIVTLTDRFKGAVLYNGLYDLAGIYGLEGKEWYPTVAGLSGNPWNNLRGFILNSPYYNLSSNKTPLLIINGRQDGLPPANSDYLFTAVDQLGGKATYVKYAHEGHVIVAPDDVLDFWRRTLRFLGQQEAK